MNNMKTFFTNKKVAIPVIFFIVVLVIAVITGFSVHNAQVAKEKEKAEKEAKAHLEELTEEFDTAKFQIENAILEDAERTTLLESLNGYEKKLDGISKEDEKEFDTLCTSIEEKYTASAATLDNAVAGIATTYPTEEGYYTEEFTASVNALMDELNTLKADGKYQEAFNKFNEINGTYAAYVEQVNAERAAAEEAAKKAEAESKKNSSSTSTEKNNNKESTDNVFSEDRSYPSGYDSYEEYQESLAAKAQANAQGYPVPYGNVFIPPDGWTVDQIFDWAHANGY